MLHFFVVMFYVASVVQILVILSFLLYICIIFIFSLKIKIKVVSI